MAANPWFGLPRSAALEHVPPPPALPADAPGPLALADPDRTRLLLRDAGWRDIELVPHETSLLLGGPGTLETAVEFLRAGSMGQTLLANVDAATATRALERCAPALTPFVEPDGVRHARRDLARHRAPLSRSDRRRPQQFRLPARRGGPQ